MHLIQNNSKPITYFECQEVIGPSIEIIERRSRYVTLPW